MKRDSFMFECCNSAKQLVLAKFCEQNGLDKPVLFELPSHVV